MKKNVNTLLKLFLILLLSSVSVISFSQNSSSKQAIDALCDKFMQTFRNGKFSEAIQMLKQNSVISQESIDKLDGTVSEQAKTILPAYGKIISHEFIGEKTIKDFLARRLYLLRFEKYYLKFDFMLYNNGSGWTITNFNYDADVTELLN